MGTLGCVWREKRGREGPKQLGLMMLLIRAVVYAIFPVCEGSLVPILEMWKAEVQNGYVTRPKSYDQ